MPSIQNYPLVVHWIKLLTITGGSQALIQGFGLVTGILVIRLMPTQEYAWYTIANTMLGTLTILSDGGISTGVMAEGGKVWQDKEKLGQVLTTGMQLRKRFAFGSLLISIPILFYLLLHQHASWLTAIVISLSLMPAFFAALSDTLLEIPLKLHQSVISLQKNQLGTAFGRLVLMGMTLFFYPLTFVALLGNGIPRIVANIRLRNLNRNFILTNAKIDLVVKANILRLVYRILPGSIYYCVSGQITVWLLSLFGSSVSISQIGGLGRIAVILTIFTTLLNTLIIPRFSTKKNEPKELNKFFIKTQLFILFFSIFLVFIFYLFAKPFLFILGDNFSGLRFEYLLSIGVNCIGLMAGLSFSMYTSKGWAINPLFSIPINLLSIVVGVLIFRPSSLLTALWFSFFINTIQYIINTAYCFYKINRLNVLEK